MKFITGQLCTTPMTNYTHAKQTLTEHGLQLSHNTSMSDTCQCYRQVSCWYKTNLNIKRLLSLEKNREFLKCCGRQIMALRSYHEIMSFKNDESMQIRFTSEGNPGNLLRLLVELGDMVLKEHLSSAPNNAKYQSPTFQITQLLLQVNGYKKKILHEVRAAIYFSVCADEASGVANKEQLSLILRFVDQAGMVREEFLSFLLCEYGTTGEAVSNPITNAVRKYGLDLRYLCGQGYDSAGNGW